MIDTAFRAPQFDGYVDSRFEAVVDAFHQNFADGVELGASFTLIIEDEIVVDIHGGFTDRKKETPWSENTIACIYSSGKAIVSMLMARAVSEGKADYDEPVASYWPEFAANGKGAITLAQMLSHQGGLCGFPDEIPSAEWLDWEAITSRSGGYGASLDAGKCPWISSADGRLYCWRNLAPRDGRADWRGN